MILSLLVVLNLFGYLIMFNVISTLTQIRDLDRVYLKLFFESKEDNFCKVLQSKNNIQSFTKEL